MDRLIQKRRLAPSTAPREMARKSSTMESSGTDVLVGVISPGKGGYGELHRLRKICITSGVFQVKKRSLNCTVVHDAGESLFGAEGSENVRRMRREHLLPQRTRKGDLCFQAVRIRANSGGFREGSCYSCNVVASKRFICKIVKNRSPCPSHRPKLQGGCRRNS